MLNGTLYSRFFPGEIPEPNDMRNEVKPPPQLMSPTLRAALDELEKELRVFLQGQSAGQD